MPLSWTALLTEATLVFLLISSDHMSLESSLNERCLEIMWVQSTKNKKQTDPTKRIDFITMSIIIS